MPEQIRCPSCNATLRVPDTLLGKNVKCPKCQTTFTAATDAPEEPEEGIVHEPAPAARRRPAPPAEEDEEEAPPEEEYEEEDRPRRRRKRGRRGAAAASAVTGPAISLMIVGGLGILMAIIYLVMQLLNIDFSGQPPPRAGDPSFSAGYQAGQRIGKASGYVWGTLGVFWGVILLVGAVRMKQLKNFGLAMTTCILALLPCNCCCILGLPFGIWGLVVLNKPEVKESFS